MGRSLRTSIWGLVKNILLFYVLGYCKIVVKEIKWKVLGKV